MFWKKFFKTPITVNKSKAELALENLNKINLLDCNRLYSSDYAIITTDVLTEDIKSYNLLLDKIVNHFINDEYLSTYNIPVTTKSISFNNFLLDKQRNYIDLDIHFVNFINLSKEFLLLFIDREKTDEKSSPVIRNLRLTSVVVDNILHITEKLKNV